MKQYSLIFFIRQSLRGLFMNSIMSITSVFILTSCLILTGCSVLLIINADINLRQLDNFNKIIFFIDREYESPEEVRRIQNDISRLANVKSFRFVSKEEALERVREQFESFGALFEDEVLFNNVRRDITLEHSVEIEYNDINDIGTLDYQLRLIEGVARNQKGEPKVRNQVETAELIRNLRNIIMLVLIGFLIILFAIAIFIILNTVRLSVHARKQEIIIMRYIGATNFFIVCPFLLEGIIIGLVSAVITYIMQSYIYNAAVTAVLRMDGGIILEFIEFSEVNIMLFFGFLFAGIFCGICGSGLSSRKYLKA